MSKYLVDTTLLVEHLRGNAQAKTFLENNSPNISTVSIAELIQGSKSKSDLSAAIKLCTSLKEVVIDKKVCTQAITLMKQFYLSHGLAFLDALIAAMALENKLILITDNLKHFNFIEGLQTVPQKEVLNKV